MGPLLGIIRLIKPKLPEPMGKGQLEWNGTWSGLGVRHYDNSPIRHEHGP